MKKDKWFVTISRLMNTVANLANVVMHLDTHLNAWALALGSWTYAVLFLVIFCETGLVVVPFLPGDSLLFALGAMTATQNAFLDAGILTVLLITAAVLGNIVNYSIGKFIGPKVFYSETASWLNKSHLMRAREFYERHGGKTIILTRYMPIIRTFAPFVAGIARMSYPRFLLFNFVGGVSWVGIFIFAGRYFGNLPSVRNNFHLVIAAIIIISFLPVAVELFKTRASQKTPP